MSQGALWDGAWKEDPAAFEKAADDVSRLGWLYVYRFKKSRKPTELMDFLALLGHQDLAYLRAVRFLQSEEVDKLLQRGNHFLRRLPQSYKAGSETAREARGKINWPATLKRQLSNGNDRSLLEISSPNNHYDRAENRCLSYALHCIREAGRHSSLKHRPASIDRINQARQLLSNSALGSLNLRNELSQHDRQALRLSKFVELRETVGAVIRLHDALFSDELDGLRETLGERIWIPPEADKLFELWCLFYLVEVLEKDRWLVSDLRVIGSLGALTPEFTLKKGEVDVSLSYQSADNTFGNVSRYREILDCYGVSGASRRPDILVTAKRENRTLRTFVEVKLTKNRDYIADSIYKSLAYISDFAKDLQDTPNPKGILLVWDGVTARASADHHELAVYAASSKATEDEICSVVSGLARALSQEDEGYPSASVI